MLAFNYFLLGGPTVDRLDIEVKEFLLVRPVRWVRWVMVGTIIGSSLNLTIGDIDRRAELLLPNRRRNAGLEAGLHTFNLTLNYHLGQLKIYV
jgi:hypothetical protein